MFYHIKKICELIKENVTECEYIIFSRSDITLSSIDEYKIKEYITKYDLILNGVHDHFFVFNLSKIDIFINLYDDFTKYLYEYYHSGLTFASGSWRPDVYCNIIIK